MLGLSKQNLFSCQRASAVLPAHTFIIQPDNTHDEEKCRDVSQCCHLVSGAYSKRES